MGQLTFILGGARSGKSRFAQELAARYGNPVLYVATAAPGDAEMAARIAQHQKERPAAWRTVVIEGDLGRRLSLEIGDAATVVIDCLTVLLGNRVSAAIASDGQEVDSIVEERCRQEAEDLVFAIDGSAAHFIVVSNEVGLGLVPAYASGRLFRDLLGWANQCLAQRADEVYLMIAGLPMSLKSRAHPGPSPGGEVLHPEGGG